jgi:DMSO/TMAO reductase YedYZ heme-binding membrane subunit
MIKLLFDFIQFLYALAPLLMSVAVFTLLALLLSKSIKRHARVYYIVFAIPFAMVAIPFVCRLLGVEMFNFSRIPFMGGIIRDYVHVGTLGFPLLIIIMYMGALSPKNSHVKKLLSIRKELSILSGFPILAHSLIRATNNFPNALKFFIDSEGYMASGQVTNALGAGISNFSFVLGIVMLALFIPLWVTSFDFVHKRMGNAGWKKLQRWSYVLYATLFIHAMGIQAGSMLNPRGGRTHNHTVEVADMNVSQQAKQYVHIASLLLISGSYVYLRLRKARLKKQ